jgi:hypothetical protein
MTDEQASDWEYKIICCLGISTSNSDINVVGLHKTVTELYEQGRADEREPQVCCGDYEKCMKACTPRGRWLAENELAQPEQEPVAKHVCNLWINPETSEYEVDRCTHPINEVIPVYTAPPRKEWVGLTDDEIKGILDCGRGGLVDIKKAEQILKEKNGG